jgi:predicted RNA-binding protein with EMAP domain
MANRSNKPRPVITVKSAKVSRRELEQALPEIIREHLELKVTTAQVNRELEEQVRDLRPRVDQLSGVLGETQDYLKTLPDPANDVEKWVRARLLQRIGRLLEVAPGTSTSLG